MSKRLAKATEALTDAFTELVSAVLSDAGNGADLADALPGKKKKPVEDDDAAEPADKKTTLKALAKLDLTEMARPDMKPYAEALGIETQGMKSDDLRKALQAALDKADGGKKSAEDEDDDEAPKKKKKPVAADDDGEDEDEDEDEDEAPKKKKKPVADDEDEAPAKKKKPADEDDEDEPDLKTMRKELKIFCQANKVDILKQDKKFFSGIDSPNEKKPRIHQILADEDLLRETWNDEIKELHEGTGKAWKKLVAAVEADSDDD